MEKKKTMTITAPDGMVIDEKALAENRIEFLPEKKELPEKKGLPKKWELDYGKQYWFVGGASGIMELCSHGSDEDDRNSLPTEELAEAMLAMCQLLTMRDRYNVTPVDWTDADTVKYCIEANSRRLERNQYFSSVCPMAFHTAELRDEFMTNFKDLLEIAKPLL